MRDLVRRGLDRLRGETGETLACRHLVAQGYIIAQRNYRCRSGEIDVIARLGATTVFVEVKGRRGASHGAGHESVTMEKRRRIVRAAMAYAAQHGLGDTPVRFDVVSVDWKDGRPELRHDENAFDADGL